MSKQFLTLTPTNRAGVFNRSARDDKGNIKEQMTFQVGVFVDIESISKPMLGAICDDIGNQILVAIPNENDVPKISWDATNQMVLEIAEKKIEVKRPLNSIQRQVIESAKRELASEVAKEVPSVEEPKKEKAKPEKKAE